MARCANFVGTKFGGGESEGGAGGARQFIGARSDLNAGACPELRWTRGGS
ncbi:MAG: hypothetical protein AAB503_01385 [Patescibacteria group bacterium]